MRLDELDYDYPAELIAQRPTDPRDACRLLVVDRGSGELAHRGFTDLPELLRPDDVVVLNDSRVLPARMHATKPTGGRVELLFLHPAAARAHDGADSWEALARPSNRLHPGGTLTLPGGETVHLVALLGEGRWLVAAEPGTTIVTVLQRHGEMPLPPYIKTPLATAEEYQTVFAEQLGSAAAPTAGLHFTAALLQRLAAMGVQTVRVTLHVGLDTFRPITEPTIEDHAIHREAYEVEPEAAATLDAARAEGRRLVAVGTTAVRVLETLYADAPPGGPPSAPLVGSTAVYITPGYRFRAVGALLTNFHLPRTSLLALVMAFAGADTIRAAYAEAIARRYRLFSFGDAMLIAGQPPHQIDTTAPTEQTGPLPHDGPAAHDASNGSRP
jgi:S-adenosylmethionine:tRNA ribosyltransferase-isomerase